MNYQVSPSLTDDEFERLKADIAQNGVLVPVEYDELGNILDGHHRVRACEELSINDWPRIVRVGLTEEQKLQHARRLNLIRRHLTREQRQDMIRAQLRDSPKTSDRQIASALGVSNSTVSIARRELIESGQVCDSNTSTGADGKLYPRQVAKPITLYNPHQYQINTAKRIAENLEPELMKAVEQGKLSVSDASKVLDWAGERQKEVAAAISEEDQAGRLSKAVSDVLTQEPGGAEQYKHEQARKNHFARIRSVGLFGVHMFNKEECYFEQFSLYCGKNIEEMEKEKEWIQQAIEVLDYYWKRYFDAIKEKLELRRVK